MLIPRLRLGSAMAGATMLLSKIRLRSPAVSPGFSLGSSNGSVPLGGGGARGRVRFSSGFARVSLRCFASSPSFDRIQVRNPIVEMDGESDLLRALRKVNSCRAQSGASRSALLRKIRNRCKMEGEVTRTLVFVWWGWFCLNSFLSLLVPSSLDEENG